MKIAIAKAVNAKELKAASKDLAPGEYDVAACIWVQGKLRKGEDYEQNIVAKADPWGLLAIALSKLNGVTVGSLTREALEASADKIKEIKEQAKAAIGEVKAPTLTACNGKIHTDGLFAEALVEYDVEVVSIETVKEEIKKVS